MAYKLLKGTYTVPNSQLSAQGAPFARPNSYITTYYNGYYTVYQTLFFNVCDIFGLEVYMYGDSRDSYNVGSYNIGASFFVKAVEAPDTIKPTNFIGLTNNSTNIANISAHFYYLNGWENAFNYYCPNTGPAELRLIDMLEPTNSNAFSISLSKITGSPDYKYDPNKTLIELKELARTSGAYFKINKQSANIHGYKQSPGAAFNPKFPCSEFSLIVPNNSYSAEEVNEVINNTNLIKTNIDNIDIQSRYNKVQYTYNLGISKYNGCLDAIQYIRSREIFKTLDNPE